MSNSKWFGVPWGANCGEGDRIEIPLGKKCGYFRCREPILPTDQGVVHILLSINAAGEHVVTYVPYHLDCQLFGVGAYTTHERNERCDCDESFARVRARRLHSN